MSLSDLSAQDINMRVAKVKFPDAELISPIEGVDHVFIQYPVIDCDRDFPIDYCNDDALAFRLMVDNKIDLDYMPDTDTWSAEKVKQCDFNYDYCYESDNKSPSRAIAECFLKMNGVES